MIKRIIFDIDYTLVKPNYDKEYLFLKEYVNSDNSYFIYHMYEILKEYEDNHLKYEMNSFLNHLNKYAGEVVLDEKFFYDWINYSAKLDEQNVEEVHKVLSYLKNSYELIALSNWLKEAQIKKLEQVDLLKYFSTVYGGDDYLKPNLESYYLAIGNHRPEECIMIGDNLDMDVIGPINAGLHAFHYTNGKEVDHGYQKIKNLSELKSLL